MSDENVTREQLKTMSKDEILQADRDGKLDWIKRGLDKPYGQYWGRATSQPSDK